MPDKAIELQMKHEDNAGLWETADDLARAYLNLADIRRAEHSRWLALADESEMVASIASTQVWNMLRSEPLRLKIFQSS